MPVVVVMLIEPIEVLDYRSSDVEWLFRRSRNRLRNALSGELLPHIVAAAPEHWNDVVAS
jgi:hypothetical protein